MTAEPNSHDSDVGPPDDTTDPTGSTDILEDTEHHLGGDRDARAIGDRLKYLRDLVTEAHDADEQADRLKLPAEDLKCLVWQLPDPSAEHLVTAADADTEELDLAELDELIDAELKRQWKQQPTGFVFCGTIETAGALPHYRASLYPGGCPLPSPGYSRSVAPGVSVAVAAGSRRNRRRPPGSPRRNQPGTARPGNRGRCERRAYLYTGAAVKAWTTTADSTVGACRSTGRGVSTPSPRWRSAPLPSGPEEASPLQPSRAADRPP